jgi:transcription factor C subunit 6
MARGMYAATATITRGAFNGAAETPRRNSGRRVSYNYKDAFKGLELSGSESEAQEYDASEIEEPDDFVPPGEEDDDPDEFVADAVEDEEEEEEEGDDGDGEEDANEEDGTSTKKIGDVLRKKSIAVEPGSALDTTPITPIRSGKTKSLRTSGLSGVRCVGTPGVAGARYIPLGTKADGAATTRQRAVGEWREGGQESRLKNLFGPTSEDLRPVFDIKKTWLSQMTFPSRSFKHLAPSPYITEEARTRDVRSLRQWYANVGRAAFAQGQKTVHKDEDQAQAYLVNPGPESLDLLMGNLKKQRIWSLKKGRYMGAAVPFGSDSKRKGWIFHLGSRIQDAQWAPNERGSTQYLAVIVEQDDTTAKKHKSFGNPKAPAFTATSPFPASIQIWVFESTPSGNLTMKKEPCLALVICTDWGAPKAIQWWPIGAEDSLEPDQDGVVRVGLLASIWSDGKVRILDVSLKQSTADSSRTQYVHCTETALELAFWEPPSTNKARKPVEKLSTLPTCLCWLSPTTLAVGTASGNVAIWTLTQPGMFPSSNTPNADKIQPQPWFHKQLADTYIITISSGYPSRPQFLSLTTADGFARLIDLRAPVADAISSLRGRMLVHSQAWHEHTQSFIMVDEYYMLKHSTLRRYNQAIYTFRTDSTLTAVATSPVHPAVLIGTSDGSVAATNGVCKIMNSKEIPWSQMWFKHEWRRAREDGESDAAGSVGPSDKGIEREEGSDAGPDVLARPLARVTEGYTPVQTSMQYPDATKRHKDGAKFITVFEENSAATRVAWNPSLKCGTWAVAGMQSGMLRVEDLGV